MVNTLKGCEDYYRQRGQLWEIQTLTRTRPVAGDLKLGEQFQKLAATLTNFKQREGADGARTSCPLPRAGLHRSGQDVRAPCLPLAAYRADWRAKVHEMRLRIERERTPRGKDDLAIKTGSGGLMDAEFIARAGVGPHHLHCPGKPRHVWPAHKHFFLSRTRDTIPASLLARSTASPIISTAQYTTKARSKAAHLGGSD